MHKNLPDPSNPVESEAAPGGEGREKTESCLRSPFLLQAPIAQQADFEGCIDSFYYSSGLGKISYYTEIALRSKVTRSPLKTCE